MMAAVLRNVELGLKKTGTTASVPDNPKAKLMFYLNCICTVLDLKDSTANLARLRDYRNYHRLSESEVDELVILCLLISPDVLLNKCIFHNEEMCGNSRNEFYELSAVASEMLVTESVLIGGQRRRVQTIMTFKGTFLQVNYLAPMKYYKPRLERLAGGARRQQQPRAVSRPASTDDDCCCAIL